MHELGSKNLGELIRRRRVMIPLTLQQLATMAGVSASHLGRIEKGKRFPSAHILQKIAKPLGFEEDELFTLAGYLSHQPYMVAEKPVEYNEKRLDPYVALMLSQEPVEVQRAAVAILSILKSLARESSSGEKTSTKTEVEAGS